MVTTTFEARTRAHGDIAVIDLHGDIDRGADETIAAAYDAATAGGHTTVLLNFSDVDYINSTGIALIVGLLARGRKEGRKVAACGLSDHYREIFEITRLSDFMVLYADEAHAVGQQPLGTG